MRGLLLAVAAACLMAFAAYNLAGVGECSSPPEEGLPACPDQILLHGAAFAGAIVLAVGAGQRSVQAVTPTALAGGYATGALLAARLVEGVEPSVVALVAAPAAVVGAGLTVAGMRRKAEEARMKTGGGVVADGTVLAVEKTSAVSYGNPVYRVRMRIEPFGMMPVYEDEQQVPLPVEPRVGDRCVVWVSFRDPSRWVFENGSPPAPPVERSRRDVVVEMATLNAARRAGRIDDAELARLSGYVLGP